MTRTAQTARMFDHVQRVGSPTQQAYAEWFRLSVASRKLTNRALVRLAMTGSCDDLDNDAAKAERAADDQHERVKEMVARHTGLSMFDLERVFA
jgi:hypothetical protein